MSVERVLIAGEWVEATARGSFRAWNPRTEAETAWEFPVSSWSDCDQALTAAAAAAVELRVCSGEKIADFLEKYAARIEARAEELIASAHEETALPVTPWLKDAELPRTTTQLRQGAAAAKGGSWRMATIDSAAGIRSVYEAIGPVCVFGPNNFPFAFNSVAGGDFAAAIAAGNPVIGKANTSHPRTTQIFAEEALEASKEAGLPAATVQLIYRTSHEDGAKLVSDSRIAATGYTGSRGAGLVLKAAADAAGKPIYLELSSVNPVLVFPGALQERAEAVVDDFTGSCLMGTGQFCTNPGLVILQKSEAAEAFVAAVAEKFGAAPVGTLLSGNGAAALEKSVAAISEAGAEVVVGGTPGGGTGFSFANTILRASGEQFLKDPEAMQTEAFGNASLFVVADDEAQAGAVIDALEGNLTGCVYSDTEGGDDAAYDALAPRLAVNVGRILNDKMPTGVALSQAMNHGGPFPATGHPGFTAVGIPASMVRFAALRSYDGVRKGRLPTALRDVNPGNMWRKVDGAWSMGDVG